MRRRRCAKYIGCYVLCLILTSYLVLCCMYPIPFCISTREFRTDLSLFCATVPYSAVKPNAAVLAKTYGQIK